MDAQFLNAIGFMIVKPMFDQNTFNNYQLFFICFLKMVKQPVVVYSHVFQLFIVGYSLFVGFDPFLYVWDRFL